MRGRVNGVPDGIVAFFLCIRRWLKTRWTACLRVAGRGLADVAIDEGADQRPEEILSERGGVSSFLF